MMSSVDPLGPANAARWHREAIGGDTIYPQWLLLMPDAVNPPGADAPSVFYVLPRLPSIARTPDGFPLFALTLTVSQIPGTQEAIAPLVERGHLSFMLDMSIAPETMQRLTDKRRRAGRLDDSFHPLAARSVLATLEDDLHTVASSSGSGADAQVAFSVALNRAQALAVLDALNGIPGSLRILLDIGYTAINRENGGTTEVMRTLSLEAPLHTLLDSLLSDSQWNRCVRLVTRTGDAGTADESLTQPYPPAPPAAPQDGDGVLAAQLTAIESWSIPTHNPEPPIRFECSA